MHMARVHGSTDILDMAFISPNLAMHDIQFHIGVDLGSDHLLPIEISINTTPHRNASVPDQVGTLAQDGTSLNMGWPNKELTTLSLLRLTYLTGRLA